MLPLVVSYVGGISPVPSGLYLVTAMSPMIGAIVARLMTGIRFKDGSLLLHLVRWDVYVIGLLIFPVIAILERVTFSLFDVISLTPSRSSPTLIGLTIAMSAFFQAAFAEEMGWRGYFQPALERWLHPLAGAAVVALAWGFWHVPGILGGMIEGAEFSIGVFGQYLVILYLTSIVYGWLHDESHDVWAPTLGHFGYNVFLVAGVPTYLWSASTVAWVIRVSLLVFVCVGIGCIQWNRWRSRDSAAEGRRPRRILLVAMIGFLVIFFMYWGIVGNAKCRRWNAFLQRRFSELDLSQLGGDRFNSAVDVVLQDSLSERPLGCTESLE